MRSLASLHLCEQGGGPGNCTWFAGSYTLFNTQVCVCVSALAHALVHAQDRCACVFPVEAYFEGSILLGATLMAGVKQNQ